MNELQIILAFIGGSFFGAIVGAGVTFWVLHGMRQEMTIMSEWINKMMNDNKYLRDMWR